MVWQAESVTLRLDCQRFGLHQSTVIKRLSLRGLIKCCNPSVCLFVTIHWKSVRHRNFKLDGETSSKLNWKNKFEVKKSNDKVVGEENIKSFFRAYLPKMSRFTSNTDRNDRRLILPISVNTEQKYLILWYLSVCLSVCLSVTRVPVVHSILERRRKFVFYEKVTPQVK